MKVAITIFLLVLSVMAQQGSVRVEPNYPVSEKEAAKVVAKVLKASPVIDGHNDLFIHFFACKECPRDFTKYRIDVANAGHTDIPRWRKGGVGATLLNIERDDTLDKFLSAYDIAYRCRRRIQKI